MNKRNFNLILMIGVLILLLNLIPAYRSSNAQTTSLSSTSASTDISCDNQGSDFLIQIAPLGCTPAVVRSDLLEENNVKVYCQLGATQINPLIDVKAIDTVSFSGKYSPQISGIGFHQAKSALGVNDNLNTPVLSNIGYVVIELKKQTNSSAMPNSVSGELTAQIKYDIKEAYGIGNALFYLSEFSEEDWEVKKSQYSFWEGKGFVRADLITNTQADISVYTNSGLLSSIQLKQEETSDTIYMPGFDCDAGFKLKLQSLENPDTRARLKINAEVVEVAKGEKFLDNKCSVADLKTTGLIQQVNVKCNEDDKVKVFSLSFSPKLILNIDGTENEFGVGDKLYESSGKKVFLGYIGTTGNSNDKTKLFAYLVSMPINHGDSLSEDEISSINSVIGGLINAKSTTSGIVEVGSDAIKKVAELFNLLSRRVAIGEKYSRLNYGDKNNFEGAEVLITDFGEPKNKDLSEKSTENYKNAMNDYEKITDGFSSESYSYATEGFSSESYFTGTTYGEEALYKEIELANQAEQRRTALELCEEFEQNYPNSKKDFEKYCNKYKLSNEDTNSVFVTIKKEIKQISFEGIYEPGFDDYGATILVTSPTGTENVELDKNEVFYLNKEGTDYIRLNSLTEDSSQVLIIASSKSKVINLNKDVSFSFGGYSFTLSDINLEKTAKVSVTPNINNAGTTANFNFNIEIEKRAIQLAPEKIRDAIDFVDGSIKKFEEVSNVLGGVTQTLKTACVATGAGLIVKNFISNAGGEGIARTYLMRGTNSWTDKCTTMVSKGDYSSLDDCFNKNANLIDSDVANLTRIISEQNSKIKILEESVSTTKFLAEQVVDTDAFMGKYSSQVNSYLKTSSGFTSSLNEINKENIMTILSKGYEDKIYSIEQLRNVELYTKILDDSTSSAELKEIAKSRLHSTLKDIEINSGNFVKINQLSESSGINPEQIGWLEGENVKSIPYKGLTLEEVGLCTAGLCLGGEDSNTPVYIAQHSDGNTYLFILDDSAGTSKLPILKREDNQFLIYNYNTMIPVLNPEKELTNIYFEKYDSATYKNKYQNAELNYYETEPYKGLPALVPFDTDNGWYASIKQTLGVGANIASYDASARVTSFYLCNVGKNGIEENIGGDDKCEMINTGTGQPYNQFPGLSETDARKYVTCAINAIEQASKLYSSGVSGKVKISTSCGSVSVEVGSPAVDIPQFQCQDFMSPKECLLLFNLCDPVICPPSRCNLGGTYEVRDVIQSGVLGSITLCLPNAKEGIIMPVCITGVKAGIDGLLSIQKAFRDCLQESLDTGNTVGVCDELFSIGICDLIWKETIPLTRMILPKIIETLSGQNVRGGGEYLGIENAFSVAEDSVGYFANYYGAGSVQAFISRTTTEFGTEICRNSISATLPNGGELIDLLTKPDSPVQFHGRFDQSSLSDATVPPTSHYKVFYHIYAGEDAGAYYNVYLKGLPGSSYYQDTAQSISIASGYVGVGDYASETIDKIAISGYKELCIKVNEQEECGFKEVSTSFALDYVTDKYVSSQAEKTNIETESSCVSGTANLYGVLLNLNPQAAAESLINPAIYNNGIIRICATNNPGQGTDPYIETENARWVDVGYCGNENMRCWIDKDSVKNTIEITPVEEDTLDSLSKTYSDILTNEGHYLTDSQFYSAVKEINDKTNPSEKIDLVNKIIENVFLNSQKANLHLLRGDAYADLLGIFLSEKKEELGYNLLADVNKQTLPETSGANEDTQTSGINARGNAGEIILNTAKEFSDEKWEENRMGTGCEEDEECYDDVCARFVLRVLINSDVKIPEIADLMQNNGILSWSELENIDNLIKVLDNNKNYFTEIKDFSTLEKGDIVVFGVKKWIFNLGGDKTQHVTIFNNYHSTNKNSIQVYGEPGFENAKGTSAQLQTLSITSDTWYVYKAYRYAEKSGTTSTTSKTIGSEDAATGIVYDTNGNAYTPSATGDIYINTRGEKYTRDGDELILSS